MISAIVAVYDPRFSKRNDKVLDLNRPSVKRRRETRAARTHFRCILVSFQTCNLPIITSSDSPSVGSRAALRACHGTCMISVLASWMTDDVHYCNLVCPQSQYSRSLASFSFANAQVRSSLRASAVGCRR
ncbi:hypothetical protein MRB53_040203 [Persea americana]|nr:hypothetical protein MRB53_040203 [Persea americana]